MFADAGVAYPPSRIALIALKEEMELELWADLDGEWVHVHTYDILAASGGQGPKQRRGDLKVPEGIYRIVDLNPASRYHLSIKLNYPNEYDRQKARADGRYDLGGDIYIHGKAKSSGCLAVGDAAIEELFFLVAKVGTGNVRVVIAPNDMRKSRPEIMHSGPSWLPELYESIGSELSRFGGKHPHDPAVL
jgi:murein L,D-transpeptidase YafK